MTLNIDLEDVPFAILEAVKARIMANRRRLQQSPPRRSTRPRPQFIKLGANSRTWRLPEDAAMGMEEARAVAHTMEEQFNVYSGGLTGVRFTYYSGNFAKSASTLLPVNGSFEYANFYLPVGRDVVIAIIVFGSSQYVGSPIFGNVLAPPLSSYAFLISRSNVRPIQIQGKMAEIIPLFAYNSNVGSLFSSRLNIFWTGSNLFRATQHDASVFAEMSNLFGFPLPSMIKSKANPRDWLGLASTRGYFSESQTDKNMYYERWVTDKPPPGLLVYDYVRDLPEYTTYATPATFYPSDRADHFLRVIWDWDDPDYCRRMCLALGFSASDLTP